MKCNMYQILEILAVSETTQDIDWEQLLDSDDDILPVFKRVGNTDFDDSQFDNKQADVITAESDSRKGLEFSDADPSDKSEKSIASTAIIGTDHMKEETERDEISAASEDNDYKESQYNSVAKSNRSYKGLPNRRPTALNSNKNPVGKSALKKLLTEMRKRKERTKAKDAYKNTAPKHILSTTRNGEPLEIDTDTTTKINKAEYVNGEEITKAVRRVPKTYGLHMFYRDHSVWAGVVLGILLTLSLIVIGFAVYQMILKYRRHKGLDIKNLSFSPFKGRKLDESPMYIRLSHINNPKSGNHYVVSVLDDKRDENEWSSEEEVFNISAVKPWASPASKTASPAVNKSTPVGTLTPMGTPSKKKNTNNSFSYR